ncbi:DUF3558 family protein [Amycolatopsis sp. WGS_07]|uniref:DUF3558 family protein n=1 Tax=Amycolatopsis sp. WGS_07 TaxID=3076764 RepID=UPI003872EBC3
MTASNSSPRRPQRPVLVAAAAAVAVLAAAGCTHTGFTDSLQAAARATKPAAPDATRTDTGAPGDARPNLAQLKQNPCKALTPSQTADLLGPKNDSKPDADSETKPGCAWSNGKDLILVSIPAENDNGKGLDFLNHTFPSHQPTLPVKELPATKYDTPQLQKPGSAVCIIALTTSDKQTLAATANLATGHTADPCEQARKTLEYVLANAQVPR